MYPKLMHMLVFHTSNKNLLTTVLCSLQVIKTKGIHVLTLTSMLLRNLQIWMVFFCVRLFKYCILNISVLTVNFHRCHLMCVNKHVKQKCSTSTGNCGFHKECTTFLFAHIEQQHHCGCSQLVSTWFFPLQRFCH